MQADPWHFLGIFLALLVAVLVLKSVLRIIALAVIGVVAFVILTGGLPELGL
ncbi:hypothetical protein [Pseudomonas sp.]|jgi:hypothetical protein|uniref:hypothetical protein n=1 Tax=Pseudomonas sp. TaxID=306 RepID=UPI002729FD14|nr:hypothetical protein [Pseudomonas sp.]